MVEEEVEAEEEVVIKAEAVEVDSEVVVEVVAVWVEEAKRSVSTHLSQEVASKLSVPFIIQLARTIQNLREGQDILHHRVDGMDLQYL